MTNLVKCPGCKKSLKVGAAVAGKRVKCPACARAFVIPLPEEPEESEEIVEEEEEEEAPKRPARRRAPKRVEPEDEEETEDEDDEEEEDEEDERPARKSRKRRGSGRPVAAPMGPLILGILSCVFSCAPLIGLILGYYAMNRATAAMDELPGGKRGRSAQGQLQFARILGIIGMCLSFVMFVVAVILNVTNPQ